MIEQIRPAELVQWLHRHAGQLPVVLDVREPWEVQTARVQDCGFELVAIPMAAIPARLAELDPNRPTACLCHLGGRSMQVAMYLQQHGFSDIANIAGGIHAWSLELDPTLPTY